MNQQEAMNIVDQINDEVQYGMPKDEWNSAIRALADAGYGVAWDAGKQGYVLTDIPDLSVLEQELKKNGK